MTTIAEALAHRRVVDDIVTLALRDLLSVSKGFDPTDPRFTRRAMRDSLSGVIDAYGSATGTAAADWYDDVRSARVPGRFSAAPGELPTEGQIDALSGWASTPLWKPEDFPEVDVWELALSRLTGGSQRLLRAIDRGTIVSNAERDRQATGFARYASANACAFCSMLTTRGPVYTSREKALKGHDNCKCLAVPEFRGEGMEMPDYYVGYQRAYDEAWARVGRSDPRAIASEMRQILGVSH